MFARVTSTLVAVLFVVSLVLIPAAALASDDGDQAADMFGADQTKAKKDKKTTKKTKRAKKDRKSSKKSKKTAKKAKKAKKAPESDPDLDDEPVEVEE